MKARTVGFERGMDPAEAMGVGTKSRFFKLFPNKDFSRILGNSTEEERYSRVLAVLKDPETRIEFGKTDRPHRISVTISRPPSKLNWFFLQSFKDVWNQIAVDIFIASTEENSVKFTFSPDTLLKSGRW